MDWHSLDVLEFHKVKEMLAEESSSALGLDLIRDLHPSSNLEDILESLQETSEMRALLSEGFSLEGIVDIRESVRSASIEGAILSSKELGDIARTIEGLGRAKRFIEKFRDKVPILYGIARGIRDLSDLFGKIRAMIDEDGEVREDATPRLLSLRRSISSTRDSIMERLNSILLSPSPAIQDRFITVRNGRYVIPVRSDQKGRIKGIVHDESASGATLFIEPLEVVELNNELTRLIAAERAEIQRILSELSSLVGSRSGEILSSLSSIARLDLALAKARLAEKLACSMPRMKEGMGICVLGGRHPILQRKIGMDKIVPIDIKMEEDVKVLLISGPNMGGKTVALKTMGLISLMAQSGLHVPAEEAELPVFSNIFADIGDEQSVEKGLSTFSAHMENISRILGLADDRSLVLIDEIGDGTDPDEGAALASSILERLRDIGAKTIATTHYGSLKAFVHSEDGMMNASVSFDPKSFVPKYKILYGIPGRSFAFRIAERIGLPRDLVERSIELLGNKVFAVEELLERLEEERKEAEENRIRWMAKARELEEMERELKERMREAEEEIRRRKAEARREASEIIARAKGLAEKAFKEASKGSRDSYKEVSAELSEELERLLIAARAGVQPKGDIVPGLRVRIAGTKSVGTVLEPPDKDGMVLIQVGMGKMRVMGSELELVGEDLVSKGGERVEPPQIDVRNRLLLMGYASDEAISFLETYLEEAYAMGISPVYIVHGKGKGVLKESIWRYLKGHKLVESYRLGMPKEGGSGVTVVYLKE
jgi:DNA mismatch repair protein MutS2